MFESKDRAELAKCGIVSLLDLALLVPKSFDDLSIKDEPNEGENVVEIECRFHHRKGSISKLSSLTPKRGILGRLKVAKKCLFTAKVHTLLGFGNFQIRKSSPKQAVSRHTTKAF